MKIHPEPISKRLDYWHIVPIVLLLLVLAATLLLYTRYRTTAQEVYFKLFLSEGYWAKGNVEKQVFAVHDGARMIGKNYALHQSEEQFINDSKAFLHALPETSKISWIDNSGLERISIINSTTNPNDQGAKQFKVNLKQPVTTYKNDHGETVITCTQPIFKNTPDQPIQALGFVHTQGTVIKMVDNMVPLAFLRKNHMRVMVNNEIVYDNLSSLDPNLQLDEVNKIIVHSHICETDFLTESTPPVQLQDRAVFWATMFMLGLSSIAIIALLLGMRDKHKRLQALRDVYEQYQFRNALERSLNVGIAVFTPDEQLKYASEVYQRMMKTSTKKDLRQPLDFTPYHPNGAASNPLRLYDIVGNTPKKFSLTTQLDKHTIAQVQGIPIFNGQGELSDWLISIEDVTEYKQLKAFKNNEAKRLAKSHLLINLGEMATTITHELSQPLSACTSYVAGLCNYLDRNEGQVDLQKVRDIIERMHTQLGRAISATTRVRQFMRHHNLHIEPLAVHDVLQQAKTFMENEFKAHHCQCHIDLEISKNIKIKADINMMQHVLINILKNAMEAMTSANSGKHITATVKHTDKNLVLIQICDTGPGIPEDELEKIFEPFVTSKDDGLGIGLNICRTMVESMGGRLWASSQVGQIGACINISLPIANGS